MHIREIKVGAVILLRSFRNVRKFRHEKRCKFKNLRYPVVRISRIVGKHKPLTHDPIGHMLWFKEMCSCFPAAHVDIRRVNGKYKKIRRKNSCPIRAYQVAQVHF